MQLLKSRGQKLEQGSLQEGYFRRNKTTLASVQRIQSNNPKMHCLRHTVPFNLLQSAVSVFFCGRRVAYVTAHVYGTNNFLNMKVLQCRCFLSYETKCQKVAKRCVGVKYASWRICLNRCSLLEIMDAALGLHYECAVKCVGKRQHA